MPETTKENCSVRSKRLLIILKHSAEQDILCFFKVKEQQVNKKNDRQLCADPLKISRIMHIKFIATVIVLGVVRNEGHASLFFLLGLRINSAGYTNVLGNVHHHIGLKQLKDCQQNIFMVTLPPSFDLKSVWNVVVRDLIDILTI